MKRSRGYSFPKSRSKKLVEAVEMAQGLPGFSEDESSYSITFDAGQDVPKKFWELVKLSKDWKGTEFLLDGKPVSKGELEDSIFGIGAPLSRQTPEDWKERKLWLKWERPEDLVVGERYYQEKLRPIAKVPESIPTLWPVDVVFRRTPDNPHDSNAIAAYVEARHVGHLPKEFSAVLAPLLDEVGMKTIRFPAVLTGIREIGVQVWPHHPLGDVLRIQDTRQERQCFWWSSHIEDEFQEYLMARERITGRSSSFSPQRSVPESSPERRPDGGRPALFTPRNRDSDSDEEQQPEGCGSAAAAAVIFLGFAHWMGL